MPDPISQQLDSLSRLSKSGLRDLWKQLFRTAAPPHLRKDVIIPILGYRLQERAFGSLSADSRRRLRHLARAFEADPNVGIPSVPRIKPGTRLIRQWRDQVHVVTVEETGYEYKGGRYQSLSQIARLITGTRWSGPLFFGLKPKQAQKSRERSNDA